MRGCFINSEWVEDLNHAVSARDRGLLLADGLFETLQVCQNIPLFFDDHWSRFMQGCEVLKLPLPIEKNRLLQQIKALIEGNNCQSDLVYALRYTATRGMSARGVFLPPTCEPMLILDISPFSKPDAPVALQVGGRVVNPHLPTCGVKRIGHLDAMLERDAATANGFDDVLLLNTEGELASISMGNIFFLINNEWHTPPLSAGVLPGTVRQNLCRLAPVKETALYPVDLFRTQAVFVCNSLRELVPVNQIDHYDYPESGTCDAFLAIQMAYQDLVKSLLHQRLEEVYA